MIHREKAVSLRDLDKSKDVGHLRIRDLSNAVDRILDLDLSNSVDQLRYLARYNVEPIYRVKAESLLDLVASKTVDQLCDLDLQNSDTNHHVEAYRRQNSLLLTQS